MKKTKDQRITQLENALVEIYEKTSCTTRQIEIINEVLPQKEDKEACADSDADFICQNCNCWKATRANCS